MADASVTDTDLKFFANEDKQSSLYQRFTDTLKYVRHFDVLVGYFRISGFYRLHESLEDVEQVRILIGLNIGRTSFRLLRAQRNQGDFDFESHEKAREHVCSELVDEMEWSEVSQEIEDGLRAFLRFLQEGKMEVRAYPSANIHAKVYIGRYREDDRDFGHVITGSSNFSEHGLVGQREFNVELKDRPDVEYALAKFEDLWKLGVEVTDDFVDTLTNRTWLNDEISPYDLYLKLLYEYFQEDINIDQHEADDFYRPDGFLELDYQAQAVTAAKKILDTHNGVFIADVVGLGKTYVTAMLMQQIQGRTLVICPPVLEDYWRDTFIDFGIRGYRIISLGKLHTILADGHEKYATIVLDEAHRFRNETTQRYESLHEICFGKQVVCVSATPLNNDVSDIYSLLKLFQTPRRSTIPGVRDLKSFFRRKEYRLNGLKRGSEEYVGAAQEVSRDVRDKVLKHVMVRRTRSEIQEYYRSDLERQGVSFPTIEEPRRVFYTFDDELEEIFQRTIERIRKFSYARYTPLLYYTGELSPLQEQSQRNIGGFMKSILVKRLESSFHAFQKTLERFIESYERFLELYDDGMVYLGKDVDVFDLLDNDREERLHALMDEGRVTKYESSDFTPDLRKKLIIDLNHLRAIREEWRPVDQDPKLDALVAKLESDDILADGPLLIFSEAAETGRYLFHALIDTFPGDVFFYCSDGGLDANGSVSVNRARRIIKQVLDPTQDESSDAFRILITTDVLAEGINLHRSNTVLNYDLPWNPTRVLQRVGRVNRVGTEHDQLFVYNFFPTAQADAEINLEANVKSKIQAFHDTLGEDAKYLTDEEEVTTHELFGDTLYDRLNNADTYEGEPEEEMSELKYLQVLRNLRDNDPDRFETIKRLPKKARVARPVGDGETTGLLTFFRRDKLKRFFLVHEQKRTRELSFLEAAQAAECKPNASSAPMPTDFYNRLNRNEEAFDRALDETSGSPRGTGGLSNEEYVRRRLKDKDIRRAKQFTDDDERFMRRVLSALNDGVLPDQTLKTLKDSLAEAKAPLDVLTIFREHVPTSILDAHQTRRDRDDAPREVILSKYLCSV